MFEDIQFGSVAHPAYSLLGGNVYLYACDVYGSPLNTGAGSYLNLTNSRVDIQPALWNGILSSDQLVLNGTIVNGSAGDGHLLWLYPNSQVVIEGCHFEPDASFTGDVLYVQETHSLDFSNQESVIQGTSGNCIGINCTNVNRIADSHIVNVYDASIVHKQVGGFLVSDGYKGSGNTKVFDIGTGSTLNFNRTQHTATGTTFATIDSLNYAETNLQNRGDTVTGQYGSIVTAF